MMLTAIFFIVLALFVAGIIVVPIQLEKEKLAAQKTQDERQLRNSRERILDMINVRRKR
jgi:hypothetical protein